MIPLVMVAEGEEVSLVGVQGGGGIRKRLAELGMNPGMTFRVIHKDISGPVILAVKDSRLALGRNMAYRILVEII